MHNTSPRRWRQLIVIKLREAMRAYEQRTGEVITYARLAETTGLSRATIESLGSRSTYRTTLATIDKLCAALGCTVDELLEYQSR